MIQKQTYIQKYAMKTVCLYTKIIILIWTIIFCWDWRVVREVAVYEKPSAVLHNYYTTDVNLHLLRTLF